MKDISVSAADRSGYAHYGHNNGVGAYDNDGVLKSNADVIYVSESTKNTVEYNGVYGLGNILHSNFSNPLDIRIIGDIGAPTWKEIDYRSNSNDTYYVGQTKVTKYDTKLYDIVLKNSNGVQLTSDMTQDDLISNHYNTLDNSYPALNGLESKILYEGTYTKNNITVQEYDSNFNMMEVNGKNNITVEGVGEDATITQWGFTWKRCSYIEIKNLTFNDYPEDACSFENSSETGKTTVDELTTGYLWIHNNTFNAGKNNWDVTHEQDKHEGDGATDFKGLRNVTVSYNHYYNNHKTGLVGGGPSHHQANLTFHHNWYQNNQARLPYARQANMHMYNNFYDGSTGDNMQIYDGAYAFIEKCYFKDTPKTFATKISDSSYPQPAIKAYKCVFDNCSKVNDVSYTLITNNRDEEISNGNYVSSTFDKDSSLFYCNAQSYETEVVRMDNVDELPTLIPTLAGAGKFVTSEYSVVETDEPLPVRYDNTSYVTLLDDDFSEDRTISKTTGIPTTAGLYYRILYKQNDVYYDRDANDYNNVTIQNGAVRIYDNSTSKSETDGMSATTRAYYIFDSNNQLTSGKVTYSIDLILSSVNTSWKILTFIDENGENLSVYSNNNKYLGYKYGSTETPMFDTAYTTGTYTIKLTIDYDKDTCQLSINGTTASVSYTPETLKGFSFITSEGSARTYSFDNIKVEKYDPLVLGYQLGKYTKNNQQLKALRIIGKMEFNDNYESLNEVSAIQINIDIIDLGNNKRTIVHNVTDIYEGLKDKNNNDIVDKGTNIRYYYTVIKGINDNYIGYTINATTTITLKSGKVINCSGFSYTIE